MTDDVPDEQIYPAVHLAYDFVLPSYTMLAARFEAADNRLTAILNLTTTLSLAAPIFAKSVRPSIPFASPWFFGAMAMFLLTVGVTLRGRLRGALVLPDPGVLYNLHMHTSEWMFKKTQIFFAGIHFERNAETIRRKSNAAAAAVILLAAEILALITWIAR